MSLTDEDIGKELLRVYDMSCARSHAGPRGHYEEIGKRARELLVSQNPPKTIDNAACVSPVIDKNDLRRFGFAPGNYAIMCFICGHPATADKRAMACLRCAEKLREDEIK